jgi:hypothetical protein
MSPGWTHRRLAETVTNAAVLFTNTDAAVPSTGRQVVLDGSNRLVSQKGVANGTGSGGNSLVSAVGAHVTFPHAGGVSGNSFNIATAAPTGTGTYAVTFANAMDNTGYAMLITRTNPSDFPIYVDGTKTVNGFSLANYNSSVALANLVGKIDVVVVGGVAYAGRQLDRLTGHGLKIGGPRGHYELKGAAVKRPPAGKNLSGNEMQPRHE